MSRTIIASVYEYESIPELVRELTSNGLAYEDIGIAAKNRDRLEFLAQGSDLSDDQLQAALRDMDLPQNEREYVLREFRNNAALLIINVRDEAKMARIEKMLYDRGLLLSESQTAAAGIRKDQEKVVLPVTEEELRVGKRTVETGGVRIHQRVTEKPIHQSLRLSEEHIRVERRPVNRPVSDAEMNKIRDSSFEVRQRAEEAVVSKEARVVEEVVVSKEVKQKEQTIQDKVRRTDVEVEELSSQGRASKSTQSATKNLKSGIPSEMERLDEDSALDLGGRVYKVKGWKVVGADGEKIGDLEYFLGSPAQNKAHLAVIDCGGFFSDKHVAIPVDQLRFDEDDEKIHVPFTKDDVKHSPNYSSDRREYREFFDYWSGLSSREEVSPGSRKRS